MSTRPSSTRARVVDRIVLSDHLVRLTLRPEGFVSTGIPDEWVALTVPGQFQSRYYTVRSYDSRDVIIDVVVHDEGLVTGWAQTDCVGDLVGLSEPKGSFTLPADAGWVVLVGDLTALPAAARIAEETQQLRVQAFLEVPDGTVAAYPDLVIEPVLVRGLAETVRGLDWPEGAGYFWMAGESAQMREIRRLVRTVPAVSGRRNDVMGYWSRSRGRQARAVDPAPIYAAGRAAGKSDEEIWADYDAARAAQEGERGREGGK